MNNDYTESKAAMTNRPTTKLLLIATIAAMTTMVGLAQNPPADSTHAQHQHAAAADSSLTDQLAELRAKVARLEAALNGPHVPQAATAPMRGMAAGSAGMNMGDAAGQGMNPGGGMSQMGGMGMDRMMSGRMGMGSMGGEADSMPGMNMPAQGGTDSAMSDMMMRKMGGMGMMKDMGMMNMMGTEKMKMMGRMGGMKGMNMSSALPGFPGASHLYHVGATGFFLDHPEHITLSTEQQLALNRVKEQAELKQASLERKVEETEQELWVLTSSDQPDAGKIETKIREIEKLRGDQRLAFIRSVGEAAKVLTEDQIKTLTGMMSSGQAAGGTAHQH